MGPEVEPGAQLQSLPVPRNLICCFFDRDIAPSGSFCHHECKAFRGDAIEAGAFHAIDHRQPCFMRGVLHLIR